MTTTPLPPLPDLRGGIVKHTILGELYDRLQVEQRMVAYATQARADLEAENKRLRGLLEIPPEESERVMTVVYRNPTREEVQSFMDHQKAVWFGWCHAPHQRDAARADLEVEVARLREALSAIERKDALLQWALKVIQLDIDPDLEELEDAIKQELAK